MIMMITINHHRRRRCFPFHYVASTARQERYYPFEDVGRHGGDYAALKSGGYNFRDKDTFDKITG